MRAGRLLIAIAVVAVGGGRVEAACTVSATSVSFGLYDVFQTAPTDSTGSVTYRCGNTDHHITIAISSGASSTFAPRTLVKGTEALAYNLFRDAGFSQVWGDGASGTSTYFIVNPLNNQDVVLPIYARIAAGQDVSVGSYSDAVVVTIEY